jgi:hypothetical protein
LLIPNDLVFGGADFCSGKAKHPVALPGSMIRSEVTESKLRSARYGVLERGIHAAFFLPVGNRGVAERVVRAYGLPV